MFRHKWIQANGQTAWVRCHQKIFQPTNHRKNHWNLILSLYNQGSGRVMAEKRRCVLLLPNVGGDRALDLLVAAEY